MNTGTTYDVFLSYNSRDHEDVERIAQELKARNCSTYIDRWYLKPGRDWVAALERALHASRSVAVFLGPHEMGRWQQRERAWALDRLAEPEGFPVIPVLLPGCEPPLGFMKQLMWIDLRDDPTSATQLDVLAAAIRGEQVDLDGRPAPQAMACPYRGLLAFREEDAEFFFGRDDYLIGKDGRPGLLDLVKRQTLVAVVGASGSGKSSLVSAGLIPALRKRDSGPVWYVVRMVPNVDPLYSLAEALVPLIEPELSKLGLERELNAVANDLEQAKPTTPLWGLINAVLRQQPGTERLLLFVDQWEELYTNCEKAKRRERFIAELLEATARKDSPLSVVLTVRGDFYGEILHDRPLLDRLQNAELKLGPMKPEELRLAIEGPGKNVGLTFQDGLVDRILQEAGEEPGRLPLLEFALEELWKRRDGGQLTHAGYEDLGRQPGQTGQEDSAEKTGCLSRAIATYADSVYDELSPDERQALPSLFRKLVRATAKAKEDTRRRAVLSELDEMVQRVARKLAAKRLLITTRSDASQQSRHLDGSDSREELTAVDGTNAQTESRITVEVAHEELLRRWWRLKEWVEEDRTYRQWRSRLDLKIDEFKRDGDSALFRGKPLEEARGFYSEWHHDLENNQRHFLDACFKAEEQRRQQEQQRIEEEQKRIEKEQKRKQRQKLVIWGYVCAVSIALSFIGVFWHRSIQILRVESLVERMVTSQPGSVPVYLEQLEANPIFAPSELRAVLKDGKLQPLHRIRAAYGLIKLDLAGSDELSLLLECIPTVAKAEGSNLLNALARVHSQKPFGETMEKLVGQTRDASVRNRYLAVALGLGITYRAEVDLRLQKDPSLRTSLIHRIKDFPGDLARVARLIDTTDNPDLRSALCIAIGTLGIDAAEATGQVLKRLYVEAPDGGTHSAAAWALQQQGHKWTEIEQLLKEQPAPAGTHGWYVLEVDNGEALTMLNIPGLEFGIGSVTDRANPADNVEPEPFEEFWLSDREVSVGQFYALLGKARGKKEEADIGNLKLPMTSVSWFDAVEFCNELSDREELSPCYINIEHDEEGHIIAAMATEKGKGYRLPTERQWEYACRAMSTRDYCYGDGSQLLSLYAVFNESSMQVCGGKMPNGWGLFDMHGNVWEWCDDKLRPGVIVLRGGSFGFYNPQFLRSAYRAGFSSFYRYLYLGFRVARTP